MIDRKSLFYKYFLICTAVILISFICLGAVLLLISSNYFNSEKTQMLEKSVVNIAKGISETMIDKPSGWKKSAQIKINEYAKNSGSNMLVLNGGGEVILTSEVNDTLNKLKEYPFGQERLDAVAYEPATFYIDLDGDSDTNPLTVALRFRGNGPDYFIIAVPTTMNDNHYTRDIMEIFALSAVIVLIISMVIIYLTTIKITAPIKEMSNAAKRSDAAISTFSSPNTPRANTTTSRRHSTKWRLRSRPTTPCETAS